MPVVPPTLGHKQERAAKLHVEPDWIDFHDVAPGRVRIEVAVHNRGEVPSKPQTIRLQAASIGAHTPWQPLTPVRLPAILPRRTLTIATEVLRAQPSQRSSNLSVLRNAAHMARRLDRIPNLPLLWKRACKESVITEPWARTLPLDPFELLGKKSPHWTGGIRVQIDSQTQTSRSRAQALRFAPGKTNMLLFCVGDEPDRFLFEFQGKAARWSPSLMVASETYAKEIEASELHLPSSTPMVLRFTPPGDAQEGDLFIRVRSKSKKTTETIELNLNANAPGPGSFLA